MPRNVYPDQFEMEDKDPRIKFECNFDPKHEVWPYCSNFCGKGFEAKYCLGLGYAPFGCKHMKERKNEN